MNAHPVPVEFLEDGGDHDPNVAISRTDPDLHGCSAYDPELTSAHVAPVGARAEPIPDPELKERFPALGGLCSD